MYGWQMFGRNLSLPMKYEPYPKRVIVWRRAENEIMEENMEITLRSPEVHSLYEDFKQCIADENKEEAEKIIEELKRILDEDDPLFIKMRLVLRRL